jgi:hypothetical protein
MIKEQKDIELITPNVPLIIKEDENFSPSKGTILIGSPV